MAKLNDDQLMDAIGQGDESAFQVLFERHGPKLLGYATRLLGNSQRAEDLTQEVWMKVITLAPSYKPSGHFTAWVMTMIRNAAFNVLRKEKRFVDLPTPQDEVQNFDLPDKRDLESQILNMSEIENLIRELDQLPHIQRMALVTWITEDTSYEDLARSLDVTVPALKSLLFRARRQLQERLG